jgi:uncharacterized protein
MTAPEQLFPSLTTMFKAILGSRVEQDARDLLDLFAEDGSMEFPFALEGRPKRVEGRAALEEYLRSLNARWAVDSYSDPVVHWTKDPNVVIVEFSVKGHMRDGGQAHDQVYIDVLTLGNGKIKNFRDYWNPMLTRGYKDVGMR